MKKSFDKLDDNFIEDLKLFMKFDDMGKISFFGYNQKHYRN